MARAPKASKAATETTVKKAGRNENLTPFQPGQSGNPAGRPKGSRHKLSEAFLKDLCNAWEKRGIEAIEKLADEDNTNFVKVIASLIPKELTGENGEPLKLVLVRGDDAL